MSSRNAYLDPGQRAVAGQLNRILADAASQVRAGAAIPTAEISATAALLAAGFDKVDYVAIRDADTLAKPEHPSGPMRVLAAATIGATRLIDNMAIEA
jgi:pantoate--beta-alanine ligase